MDILIMRHGDAVEEGGELGDHGRALSDKGRKTTRHVGDWLADHGKHRPGAIWTSPLVRAVQTAEIVCERVALEEVEVQAALSTRGDPAHVLRLIEAYHGPGPLLLVGHEPNLSMLAISLLGKVQWPGFKKSGVLGVSRAHGTTHFGFVLDPKHLTTVTDVKDLARG